MFSWSDYVDRGAGVATLRKTGTVVFALRQENTMETVACCFVDGDAFFVVDENAGPVAGVWSDAETRTELLTLRFGSRERALMFKKSFDDAKVHIINKVNENLPQHVLSYLSI